MRFGICYNLAYSIEKYSQNFFIQKLFLNLIFLFIFNELPPLPPLTKVMIGRFSTNAVAASSNRGFALEHAPQD
jgi:hypothetical protein